MIFTAEHFSVLYNLCRNGVQNYISFRSDYNTWRTEKYFDGEMKKLSKLGYLWYNKRGVVSITESGTIFVKNGKMEYWCGMCTSSLVDDCRVCKHNEYRPFLCKTSTNHHVRRQREFEEVMHSPEIEEILTAQIRKLLDEGIGRWEQKYGERYPLEGDFTSPGFLEIIREMRDEMINKWETEHGRCFHM